MAGNMTGSFKGKVAFVTGTANGITDQDPATRPTRILMRTAPVVRTSHDLGHAG